MADSQMYVVKRNGKKQDAAKFGGEKLRDLQLSIMMTDQNSIPSLRMHFTSFYQVEPVLEHPR